ncbi:MAG: hypothetical protein K8R48_01965 [Alphaproteobacteria bacterium]|nr:hypothetical protein [Alphaproteobacteria bacterium]
METNTKLAIVFALATGLMSGGAAMAGAVSAGAQSNVHFEIQDVTMEDGVADKIFWSVTGDANSAVAKGNELQNLEIRSPAPPADPWVFLTDRSEIRRGFAYQPTFERAALAPEIPQDRAPSLMDEYSDNKRIIMALRENPDIPRDSRVLAVIAAAFAAPGRDSIDPEGRVTTPTDELLAEIAADVPPPEETTPTIDSMYILVAARSGLLSREQYSFLAKIYGTILQYEAKGLTYPLPQFITDALIKIKDPVGGILASCTHTTFHGEAADACHADPT